jgi:CBS domain-containing protein
MLCPSCGYDNIEGMDRCENCMKSLRDLDVPRAEATGGLVRSVMEDDLRQLGREEPLTARPEEPAIDVIRRMKESHTGCALVLDSAGKLAGIFTEHDVLCKLAGTNTVDGVRRPVGELMTPNPETLRETDSVAAALSKMSIGRYRHVPVMRGDGTCTVTSVQHLLKYIAQEEW